MKKTLKPFLFVRTFVAWGENVEDARDQLPSIIDELGSDIYEDWACDLLESNSTEFVKAMGGTQELDVEDEGD